MSERASKRASIARRGKKEKVRGAQALIRRKGGSERGSERANVAQRGKQEKVKGAQAPMRGEERDVHIIHSIIYIITLTNHIHLDLMVFLSVF